MLWESLVLSWSLAEHNILMHPFHMLELCGLASLSLLYGSLVTSPYETTKLRTMAISSGRRETYNIVCILVVSFSNMLLQQTAVLCTSSRPVLIWLRLGVSTAAFNLNNNLLTRQVNVIPTWSEHSADLGLDLAAAESQKHQPSANIFSLTQVGLKNMELTKDERQLTIEILQHYSNFNVSTTSPLYEEIMHIIDKITSDVIVSK